MFFTSSITQVSHTSSAITPETAATRAPMRSASSTMLISFIGSQRFGLSMGGTMGFGCSGATLEGCRQGWPGRLSARGAVRAGLRGRADGPPQQLRDAFQQSPSDGWRIADLRELLEENP